MNIDFGKIVTNALSVLVAAVFVGAATIVWKAATTMDDRIEAAKEEVLAQQSALKATQETIVPELTDMKNTIDELRVEIRSLSKLLAEANALPGGTDYESGKPVVLEEFVKNRDPDWREKEIDRLNKQIDTRQMQIYEQQAARK